jgi:hypothetical protein
VSGATRPWARLTVASLVAVALAPLAACEDQAGSDPLAIEGTGTVQGILFFDANGTRTGDGADDPLEGWLLSLRQPAGGTVASDETDEEGTVLFEDVPVGRLVLGVGEEELGDTLIVVEETVAPFTLTIDDQVSVGALLTLPRVTIVEARETPPDKPVFVTGVALNTFPADDRTLHIRGPGAYLRIQTVEEGNVSVGDSVRVRGRTAVDQGVPVLDGAEVFRLGTGAAVTPVSLGTAEAADAQGGSLDAALVEVGDAEILEVEDLGNNGLRVRVDDGSGPVNLLLREFLDFADDDFDPDERELVRAVGLLVPGRIDGRVVWELLPRTRSDLIVALR